MDEWAWIGRGISGATQVGIGALVIHCVKLADAERISGYGAISGLAFLLVQSLFIAASAGGFSVVISARGGFFDSILCYSIVAMATIFAGRLKRRSEDSAP